MTKNDEGWAESINEQCGVAHDGDGTGDVCGAGVQRCVRV
jgi:hypothetical protein